jgi:hypothetical protein
VAQSLPQLSQTFGAVLEPALTLLFAGVCRVFLYHEGLVRFCTTPYKRPTIKNSSCNYMHLTNYAVNKHNTAAFVAPTTAAATAPQAPAAAARAAPSAPGAAAAEAARGIPAGPKEAAPLLSAAVGCCAGSQPAIHHSSSRADGCDWQQQRQQQQEQHTEAVDGLAAESRATAAEAAGAAAMGETTAAAAAAAADRGEGQGGDASKWSFQQLRQHLEAQGVAWRVIHKWRLCFGNKFYASIVSSRASAHTCLHLISVRAYPAVRTVTTPSTLLQLAEGMQRL